MSHTLKNGTVVNDPRLDRLYEEDWNSLNYPVTKLVGTTAIRRPRSYTWGLSQWLDQGNEGACVGFGFSHEGAAFPVRILGITNDFARTKVYWPAQEIDEWAGGSYPGATPFYEGTSVLAGAKIMQRLGFYHSYYWALNIQELAIGVGLNGPAVIGVNWYEGMYDTDEKGFIAPTGQLAGGHCICVIGVKIVWKSWLNWFTSRTWENVDLDRSYLVLHNSWGPSWGMNGRAKLTLRDADRLLNEQGDACFPVRNSDLKIAA
jgi:hypothetical protein